MVSEKKSWFRFRKIWSWKKRFGFGFRKKFHFRKIWPKKKSLGFSFGKLGLGKDKNQNNKKKTRYPTVFIFYPPISANQYFDIYFDQTQSFWCNRILFSGVQVRLEHFSKTKRPKLKKKTLPKVWFGRFDLVGLFWLDYFGRFGLQIWHILLILHN